MVTHRVVNVIGSNIINISCFSLYREIGKSHLLVLWSASEKLVLLKKLFIMEFVLDTNLASFMLDRELWARQPASLIRARQEIVTAYHLASSNMKDGPIPL